MREWVGRSAFLLGLSVLTCVNAWAQPSPQTSVVPACIMLVGTNGAVPDPAGTFTVTVNDVGNNPMPGVAVSIELINVNDARLCPNQPPGLTLTCTPFVTRRVCAITNGVGVATFIILGRGFGPATSQGMLGEIWANQLGSCVPGGNVLLANVSVSILDLDGGGTVGANDFSTWLTDFSSGDPWSRSDFDCTGAVGANDLSIWLTLFGLGGSALTCGPGC